MAWIDGKVNRADDLFVAGAADVGPFRDVYARDLTVHGTGHADERRKQNQASEAVSHAGSITPGTRPRHLSPGPPAFCRRSTDPFPARRRANRHAPSARDHRWHQSALRWIPKVAHVQHRV